MAQKKITDLQLRDDVEDTVNFPVDDTIQSYRVTAAQIRDYLIPKSTIWKYAGSSAPTGWLFCDGSAISRTTYADLFAVIGTTYGVGDGSTTFNIPDFRGRAPIGVGTGSGLTARALADQVGAETHQLTSSEMPSHTHTQNSHNHTQNQHRHGINGHSGSVSDWYGGSSLAGGIQYNGNQGTGTYTEYSTPTNQATTATNQNTGGDGAHNNMQPSLTVNFMIKY